MGPGSPRRLITIVLLALAVITPGSAQAAPKWLSPVDLSAGDQAAHGARVAVDAQGNAIAVWQSGRVQTASRRAGGHWSDAQDVAPGGERPQLAVSPHGSAVAIWDAGDVVQAATRPAGASPSDPRGGWSEPVGVAADPEGFVRKDPQVAIDAQGKAVAVWVLGRETELGPEVVVQAAIRPAGASPSDPRGGWSEPDDISAPGQYLPDNNPDVPDAQAQVALDAQGNAVAVWKLHDGDSFVVQAATRPAGASPSDPRGGWRDPQELAAPGQEGSYIGPQVAVGPEGNAVAAWQRANGTDSLGLSAHLVQAATRPAGASPSAPRGGWSEPQDLPVGAEDAIGAQAAVDGQGNAVVVWLNASLGSGELFRHVQAATRPAGASPSAPRGGWREPQNVSPVHQSANDAELAAGLSGDLAVVWRRYEGAGTPWSGTNDIVAATRPAGGDWTAPHELGTFLPPVVPDPPQLAVDVQGNAVAVWSAVGVADLGSAAVRAAGYDGAGPQLRDLRAPEGTAGVPLAFSVSPLDVWSEVASTQWDFGDGSTAAGPSGSHTYAAAGTYQVTVTSTDSLGNSSSEKRTVVVSGTGGSGGGTGGGPVGGGSGTVPGGGGAQRKAAGGLLGGSGPLSTSEALRQRRLRGCLSRAASHTRGERRRARRGSVARRVVARRHLRRHSVRLRRRCVARYGRIPGRVTGLRARALSGSQVELSFIAPGSDRSEPPPARVYLVKQSTRPIRGRRAFRRARRLCNGSCRLAVGRVGERVSLTITDLRPNTTYYYVVAARDAVSRALGPRSPSVRVRTR